MQSGTMTRNTMLTLTVRDPLEDDSVVINQPLTIKIANNGPARIDFSGSFGSRMLTATVGNDPDGDAADAEYQYRWQSRASGSNSWTTVSTETTTIKNASYEIPADTLAGTRYRVEVQYTDAQGYPNAAIAGNHIYRAG